MAEAALHTPPTVPNSSQNGEAVHARPTAGAAAPFRSPPTTTPSEPYNPYPANDDGSTPPLVSDSFLDEPDTQTPDETERSTTPPRASGHFSVATTARTQQPKATRSRPSANRTAIQQALNQIQQNVTALEQQLALNKQEINTLQDQISKSQFRFFKSIFFFAVFSDFFNIFEFFISLGLLASITNSAVVLLLKLIRQPQNVQRHFDQAFLSTLVVELTPVVNTLPYFSWKIAKIKYKSEKDLSEVKKRLKQVEKKHSQLLGQKNYLIQKANQFIQLL